MITDYDNFYGKRSMKKEDKLRQFSRQENNGFYKEMFYDKQILVPKEECKILNYENIIDLIKYLKRRYLFNHLRINSESTSKRFKKTKRLKISARNTLINNIDVSIVKSIIDKNPLCRFSAALVYREFKEIKPNFKCSYSSFMYFWKNVMNFTRKKRKIRIKNTIKKERLPQNLIFYNEFLRRTDKKHTFVFIDECSVYNIPTTKYYWSENNADLVLDGLKYRWKVNLILAHSFSKILLFEVSDKNTDIEKFELFFKKLVNKIIKEISGEITMIIDNASYHKPKSLEKFVKNTRINLMFTATYSPLNNCIENCFCLFKNKLLNEELGSKNTPKKLNECVRKVLRSIKKDNMNIIKNHYLKYLFEEIKKLTSLSEQN